LTFDIFFHTFVVEFQTPSQDCSRGVDKTQNQDFDSHSSSFNQKSHTYISTKIFALVVLYSN